MSVTFLQLYHDVAARGVETCPRGQRVLEVEDHMFTMRPHEKFTSFKARKFNLNYLKTEFLWYLRAEPDDDIITDHAQIWKDIVQPDGTFFSNYGQYWFGPTFNGLKWVFDTLVADQDSRRAVIPMLSTNHCFHDNKDVVCTESISFRVRGGKLNMSVNMRSQDAVWGLTNDVACFHFLWEMLAKMLRVPQGTYTHKVDSLHVYERHFKMLDELLKQGMNGYYEVDVPAISEFEAMNMPKYHIHKRMEKDCGSTPFFDWLQATT